MASETIPTNITVSFHSHTGAVIAIESRFLFTIFSVTFHLLANTDIAVIIDEFLNFTQISLPLQDTNRLCVEAATSCYTDKTFHWQHQQLNTSHHLAVPDLKQNNSKTVSII